MSIENNQAGVVVGAGTGAYKGITIILANLADISFELILQAGILAFVGGALGWLGSELMNQLKRVYINWKSKKDDKENK